MVYMQKKALLLDSSAVLNDFNFSFERSFAYVTTSQIVSELKDLRSRSLVDAALQQESLSIIDPKPETAGWVVKKAVSMGFQRLSEADFSLLALAVEFKELPNEFSLITDDYSIQNFCMLFEIPFESIAQGEIKQVISYKTICSNCGKKFSNSIKLSKCDICASSLKKTT